ncbi:hypothetical protein KIL84_007726 [Mauremys mutica]|uniref:Uncharacterized protein n=1 Tax=Mauremys mutica TaxID=74926 RepID=A0A9D4AVB9_9SAUR|nr:hypothetical protein KIL84_007726 [Mauremys mutica]
MAKGRHLLSRWFSQYFVGSQSMLWAFPVVMGLLCSMRGSPQATFCAAETTSELHASVNVSPAPTTTFPLEKIICDSRNPPVVLPSVGFALGETFHLTDATCRYPTGVWPGSSSHPHLGSFPGYGRKELVVSIGA